MRVHSLLFLLLVFLLFLSKVEKINAIVSDEVLFQSLDLSLPALHTVEQYYKSGNLTAAKEALASYYRTKPTIPWWDPYYYFGLCSGGSDWISAESIVSGVIRVVNIDYKFPNGSSVNWEFNPTYNNPNVPYDPEWQWELVRMCFWRTLTDAYTATKNETYAMTLINQMYTFGMQCPRPSVNNESNWSAWRTLDTGIRGGDTWPNAWVAMHDSPSLSDENLILWVKLFLDHANYLYTFHSAGGNWVTMEMSGLYGVGALFQEFTNSSIWRKFAAQYVYKLCQVAILPDGAWYELSTTYMQDAINNIAWPYKIAQTYNLTEDFPAGYSNVLLTSFLFDVYIMMPDASFPMVNDAWQMSAELQATIGVSMFPSNPTLAWAASNRTEGTPPNFTSIYFPDAKYIIFRTGWGTNDTYSLFDAAGLGAGHWHQDKLNLIIDSYGRHMLYDGGGGQYEQSKWRNYAVDTPSHNTILVDGQPQRRPSPTPSDPLGMGNPKTPLPLCQLSPTQDYAAGYYWDNYGSSPTAQHRREVLFVKSPIQAFIVVDTLTPNDTKSHNYQVLWNILSTKYYNVSKYQLVITNDTEIPNLAVVALASNTQIASYIAVNTSTEILGWDVDRNPPFQIPALEVIHTKNGQGVQQFVSMILPIYANTSHNITSIQHISPKDYVVKFESHTLEIVLGNDIGIKAIVN